MEFQDSQAVRRQVTHCNTGSCGCVCHQTKSVLVQYPVGSPTTATSATWHLSMPDISGAFKHQLINQPFICTEMEYVSINPTDLRDCFPAAWTCERLVSHPIY